MKSIYKSLLFILLFWGTISNIISQERVSLNEAQLVASRSSENPSSFVCSSNEKVDDAGNVVLYEIIMSSGERIIIPGVKRAQPILAIVNNIEESLFSNGDIPDGLRYFIDKYAAQITSFNKKKATTNIINSEWEYILSDNWRQRSSTSEFGPFLTTKWGQWLSNCGNDCHTYNYFVPYVDEDCECSDLHAPAGCIAVALGQIMNYWKYPVYMIQNWQFDWCNMADSLCSNDANYNQKRNAVAWLLWQCGLASETNYNFLGCNAFALPSNARDALVNDFSYDDDAYLSLKSSHTDAEWKGLMITDIVNGRPILYASMEDNIFNGGHAFVCDGYKSTGSELFHFNWGHRTGGDWCALDAIVEGSDQWNSFERAIFNIHPSSDVTVQYCDFTLPLEVHYQSYYTLQSNTTPPPYQNVPTTSTNLISAPVSSQSSWRTIPSGVHSEYKAHNSVKLIPGFYASRGANLEVAITQCESCPDNRLDTKNSHNNVSNNYSSTNTYKSISRSDRECGKIYPNPVKNLINIECNVKDVQIYNEAGNAVYRWFIESKNDRKTIINVQNIPNGVYVIHVLSENETIYVTKFVKD